MLKELKDYNAFASLQEINYLLGNLTVKSRSLPILDLKKICSDYSIGFAFSFDGTLAALSYSSIVKIVNYRVSLVARGMINKIINSPEKLGYFLNKGLFETLERDSLLTKFLRHDCLGYDLKKRKISVKVNMIPMEFIGFLKILTQMGFFISSDSSPNIVLVNDLYQELFETTLIPMMRKEVSAKTIADDKRELSYEEFKRILQIKENLGAEAEHFVLAYEHKRLAQHKNNKEIKIISSIDVWAGYDIVSFNDEFSEEIDRFIEVKSYASEPRFYWTKSEVGTARVKANNYYLYLVDRDKKDKAGYHPIIIQNPYETVFLSDKWFKDPQEWLVKQEYSFIKN
jgi:hypothetical protein